ncbi:MAG TPA: outer membrane beta-barrel protein [Bacteroidales bacterium]|jgi:outer membrane protein|nr:outer membrane beta-barrel protein [Bacteroidales bacterium]
MKNVRNLLIIAVLSLFAVSLNAQTEAGKILVGGSSELSFGAITQKYKSDDGDGTAGKITQFSLAPEAGFFVIDNLAVGLSLDMSLSSSKEDGSEFRETFTTLLAAPFVKYYYDLGKIKPFAKAAVGLGSSTYKLSDGSDSETEKTGIFGWELGVGAAMFMNDNVALEVGIGYQSISQKDKQDNDIDLRIINGGIAFAVGIAVVL